MPSHLAEAERHVREGEVRVARQAALVRRLQGQGVDTRIAQSLLAEMKSVMGQFYRDLWSQSREAAGDPPWVHTRLERFEPTDNDPAFPAPCRDQADNDNPTAKAT